ncbi:MAG: hypothetical protein J1F20_05925 [Muribaculaceae bacterium]|nr:hypothetical protein [Muribaculaceae bacterium]
MIRKSLLYISLLLAFVLPSCSEDIFEGGGSDQSGQEFHGYLTFGLSTGNSGERSREMNTEREAMVKINTLWVGIFDANTGNRIAQETFEVFNNSVVTGTKLMDAIKMRVNIANVDDPVYIVGVGNYDGVTTDKQVKYTFRQVDGTDKTIDSDLLIARLQDVKNFSELTEIEVDTESAYAGDKGENPNSLAPLMVGYFVSNTGTEDRPMIDQINQNSNSTKIFPDIEDPDPTQSYLAAQKHMTTKLVFKGDNVIKLDDGALTMHRLVTTVSVVFKVKSNLKVFDIKYKRYNMPKRVYMAQRRLLKDTDWKGSSLDDWKRLSPNAADRYLEEGKYVPTDEEVDLGMYTHDKDWISVVGDAFSFQHFENKHYAFKEGETFSDREEKNEDGSFKMLCPEGTATYNNLASYFVVKMRVLNTTTNEIADVEYTIHEGYCNDEHGEELSQSTSNKKAVIDRARDFSMWRNQKYIYTININGVKDIEVNASGEDHYNGESGVIWRFKYAEENNPDAYKPEDKHAIEMVSKTYTDFMQFSQEPNLAFRIYGVDDQGKLVDAGYQITGDMNVALDRFAGYPNSATMKLYNNLEDLVAAVPEKLLKGFTIMVGNTPYNIVDFVKNGIGNDASKLYSLRLEEYNDKYTGPRRNFMRAIYVFDLDNPTFDKDKCSQIRTVYAAEQYPNCVGITKVKLEPTDVRYDDHIFTDVLAGQKYDVTWPSGKREQHSCPDQRGYWLGTSEGGTRVFWKHDPRFEGYEIKLTNSAGQVIYETAVQNPELKKFVQKMTLRPNRDHTVRMKYSEPTKDEDIFWYPVSCAKVKCPDDKRYEGVTVSVSARPIVDKDYYEIVGGWTEFKDKIRLYPVDWNFFEAESAPSQSHNGRQFQFGHGSDYEAWVMAYMRQAQYGQPNGAPYNYDPETRRDFAIGANFYGFEMIQRYLGEHFSWITYYSQGQWQFMSWNYFGFFAGKSGTVECYVDHVWSRVWNYEEGKYPYRPTEPHTLQISVCNKEGKVVQKYLRDLTPLEDPPYPPKGSVTGSVYSLRTLEKIHIDLVDDGPNFIRIQTAENASGVDLDAIRFVPD